MPPAFPKISAAPGPALSRSPKTTTFAAASAAYFPKSRYIKPYPAAPGRPRWKIRGFRPSDAEELKDIQIEISVLTIPRRLDFKSPEDLVQKLRPGKDGVVLRMGMRQATFLPQVWEQIPDKTDFLNHLAQKAGLSASAWRDEGTSVLIYQVEAFKESKPNVLPVPTFGWCRGQRQSEFGKYVLLKVG